MIAALSPPMTVADLCDRYESWAQTYYRKPTSRRLTGTHTQIHYSIEPLRVLASDLPPSQMTAEVLDACRQWWIAKGLSRSTINGRTNRIRRMFRWAACPPQRWITSAVVQDLKLLEPLKRGRSEAKERQEVQPVEWERVAATMAHAHLELATMIELHWLTGMRPSELVSMTRSTLTERDGVTIYSPTEWKTEHVEDAPRREVVIGPAAMALLSQWVRRIGSRDRLWTYRRASTYYCAIRRICLRHGIRPWHPHQIRHAFATALVRQLGRDGLDLAQIMLGHATIQTTRRYAHPDLSRAIAHARTHG